MTFRGNVSGLTDCVSPYVERRVLGMPFVTQNGFVPGGLSLNESSLLKCQSLC